jgi:hypothetical protein
MDLEQKDTGTGDEDSEAIALMVGTSKSKRSKRRWILDSGAPCHMTPYKDNFINLKESARPEVKTAGKDGLKIKGRGSLKINFLKNATTYKIININNTLWVPLVAENLISISRLTEEGMTVIMEKKKVILKDKGGVIVAKGIREGGLYVIYEHDRND